MPCSVEPVPYATTITASEAELSQCQGADTKELEVAESQEPASDAEILAKMSTMVLEGSAEHISGKDCSREQLGISRNVHYTNSPPEDVKPSEKELNKPSSKDCGSGLHSIFSWALLTFGGLDEHTSRLWEVKQADGKGLGVFATRLIPKDKIIFQEAPLIIGGPDWLDKEASFMVLSEEKQRDYMDLHSYCNCQNSTCTETPFMRIWDINSFEVPTVGQGHSAVYKIASRVNHACLPNARYRFTKTGNIVFFALEDIAKGDEITHDYINVGLYPKSARRQHLSNKYGFYCRCRGCATNAVYLSRVNADIKIPVRIITPEILGERTAEESAALAEPERWCQDLEQYRRSLIPFLHAMFLNDHILGEDDRDFHFKEYEENVGDWIRTNNIFGVNENVIQNYVAMLRPDAEPALDGYICRIKKEEAKDRRVSSETLQSSS
jgi:SET domain